MVNNFTFFGELSLTSKKSIFTAVYDGLGERIQSFFSPAFFHCSAPSLLLVVRSGCNFGCEFLVTTEADYFLSVTPR